MDSSSLYTVAGLAAHFQVSRDFIYREVSSKRLNAVRLGRVIRIHEKDVQTYLTNRKGA